MKLKNMKFEKELDFIIQHKMPIIILLAVVFLGSFFYVAFGATQIGTNYYSDGTLRLLGHSVFGNNVVGIQADEILRIEENPDVSITPLFTGIHLRTQPTGTEANNSAFIGIDSEIVDKRVMTGGSGGQAIKGRYTIDAYDNRFTRISAIDGTVTNNSSAITGQAEINGGYLDALSNSTASALNIARGVFGRARTGDTATISSAYGGQFWVRNGTGTINNGYGISVNPDRATTIYGIEVDVDHTLTGGVQNNYGIWINALAGATTNYGIYGDNGDWVLASDGDGISGGVGAGGDLCLGDTANACVWYDGTNLNIDTDISGTASPILEIDGGILLRTSDAQPACNAGTRGLTWFTPGGAGVADTYEICAKDAGDSYAWRTIY